MRRRQQPETSTPATQRLVPGLTESTSSLIRSALEEYFTPAEVSKRLKISTKQVIRFFEGRAGVLNLGGERRPTRTDKRSKYSILRISHPALMQFLAEHQA
jgi:hypothetical protein